MDVPLSSTMLTQVYGVDYQFVLENKAVEQSTVTNITDR